MTRSVVVRLALLLLLAPAAARAGDPAEEPIDESIGYYPLPTRLVVDPAVAARTLDFEPWAGGPEAGAETVEVGARVHDAWRRTLLLQFQPAPEGVAPALELEVLDLTPGVVPRNGLWRAQVLETVVVRGGGAELARLKVTGSARVGAGEHAVRAAFGFAAVDATRDFGRQLGRSRAVGDYLAARGVAQPGLPPPPARMAYGALGLYARSAAAGWGFPLSLQGGAAGRWWFAQGLLEWRTDEVQGDPIYINSIGIQADLTVARLGVEAGVPWRLGSDYELRGGLGLHWLRATMEGRRSPGGDPAVTHDRLAPGLLAAFRWILPYRLWQAARPVVGVDVRLGLGSAIRFDAYQRTFDPASGVLLTLGLEASPGQARAQRPPPGP